MKATWYLIGCSKKKLPYTYDPAELGRIYPEELYCSDLFQKRVACAEARRIPWFVLSAGMGLWPSNRQMDPTLKGRGGQPYDFRISDLSPTERAAWNTGVAHALVEQLWEHNELKPLRPRDVTIEIHAGNEYADTLGQLLEAIGFNVLRPVQGFGIGTQLKYYNGLKVIDQKGKL